MVLRHAAISAEIPAGDGMGACSPGASSFVPEWYDEFEALLDEMLGILRPEWRLSGEPPSYVVDRPTGMSRWRTNQKRGALASRLRDYPAEVSIHLPALMDIVVHDLNPSFNEFLIRRIVAAVGYRPVHEGIIERLAHGTFTEQVGATYAWYQAQPGLHYHSSGDFHRGQPTQDSVLRHTEWLELMPRYREAGRRAVERCSDPRRRACLSELTANSSEIVSIGTLPDE
jgi:hypothetical protein